VLYVVLVKQPLAVPQALSCCLKAEGASTIVSKMLYAFQLIFVAIISYILTQLPTWMSSQDWWRFAQYIPGFIGCTEPMCVGVMAPYRITFALAVFHLIFTIMFIRVKYKSDPRTAFQNGWWVIKFPLLILVGIAGFFIPNTFFIGFAWVSLFGSGLFVLIQLVLLVDFAHTITETLVDKFEETKSRFFAAALLISTIVVYVAFAVGSILMYVFYPNGKGDCWVNTMFITLNIIFCIAISLFSINPELQKKNPRAGLFQSAVVTFYCTYQVFSAISSEPDNLNCSTLKSAGGASLFIGVCITFVSVVYSALRVSSSDLSGEKRAILKKKKDEEERKRLLNIAAPDLEDNTKTEDKQTELDSDLEKKR